jgi:hypothetical protein
VIRYFDASALVKRYVEEAGSDRVAHLLANGTAATARYSQVEVLAALARRTRDGDLSPRDRSRLAAVLERDMARFVVVELTGTVVALAGRLLSQHPLRAGDALQLASCRVLEEMTGAPVELVAFDDRLLEAAQAEGVTVA